MAGATWKVFTAGTKAKGSEVNDNFDWIEGSFVPMNAGAKTDGAYDLGEASYHWNKIYVNEIANTVTIVEISNTVTVGDIEGPLVIAGTATATDFKMSATRTRYVTINPGNFSGTPTIEPVQNMSFLRAPTLGSFDFYQNVNLPHGAIVTYMKAQFYQNTSGGFGGFALYRSSSETAEVIGTLTSDTSGGYQLFERTSGFTNATIDNVNYTYAIKLDMSPSGVNNSVRFNGGVIGYTILEPLP